MILTNRMIRISIALNFSFKTFTNDRNQPSRKHHACHLASVSSFCEFCDVAQLGQLYFFKHSVTEVSTDIPFHSTKGYQ